MGAVIIIELHGLIEANILITAMQKRLDVLANGYTRKDVIEFLTLQQIVARMSPQVNALVELENEK